MCVVPDLSQLNSKIVQLLALQRISQLLVEVTESSDNSHQPQVKAEESPVHRRKDLILDSFRQQMAAIAPHPPPSLHPPPLGTAIVIQGTESVGGWIKLCFALFLVTSKTKPEIRIMV